MHRTFRSHVTYANVMATIAVFLVLTGGTAVALSGSNTVQSDDLGPGAQVTAPDVAANAVNGSDIVNNSLTGTDINESTLQGVNAATVDGADVCDGTVISTDPAHNDVNRVICAAGPLSIRARCISFAGLTEARFTLENNADHSFFVLSGGAQNANWSNAQVDPALALIDASDAAGAVDRQSFSAGAVNGSQLAGEAGVRVRHLGSQTGSCQFVLGAID